MRQGANVTPAAWKMLPLKIQARHWVLGSGGSRGLSPIGTAALDRQHRSTGPWQCLQALLLPRRDFLIAQPLVSTWLVLAHWLVQDLGSTMQQCVLGCPPSLTICPFKSRCVGPVSGLEMSNDASCRILALVLLRRREAVGGKGSEPRTLSPGLSLRPHLGSQTPALNHGPCPKCSFWKLSCQDALWPLLGTSQVPSISSSAQRNSGSLHPWHHWLSPLPSPCARTDCLGRWRPPFLGPITQLWPAHPTTHTIHREGPWGPVLIQEPLRLQSGGHLRVFTECWSRM